VGAASPDAVNPAPILDAQGVHKRYGGVHALRGASLTIYPGEVHALIGENGSGKSTMLKILSGQVQPDGGRIVYEGEATAFRDPTDALRRGIATVTQETTLAPDLSVAENIFLGHRMVRRSRLIDWRATRRRASEALARLDLDLDPGMLVRRLRPDQQQMVEIARALSIDARVLILDEPTSSLTEDEVVSLFALVRRLRDDGVATIFVSHRLVELFMLADRVTVLRDGHSVGGGPVKDFNRAQLIELMVGRALENFDATHAGADELAEAVLRVRNLSLPGAFDDISLDVGPGEVVGLAGLVGAGRSELLEALFGVRRAQGRVELAGEQVSFRSAGQAISAGLGFVPADRKLQGLVQQMSVRDNLMMASTSRVGRFRTPGKAAESETVRRMMANMSIRAHSPSVPVSTLSGGNQQKVVLGKWLATEPKVLMLDEPTRGVDVGAKAEIYKLLDDAAKRGLGILVSSSEIPELQILCDRIIVMFRGRAVVSLTREDATEARIAHFAGGHE
jgi:ABC-type sugar transport system ATPase subunit